MTKPKVSAPRAPPLVKSNLSKKNFITRAAKSSMSMIYDLWLVRIYESDSLLWVCKPSLVQISPTRKTPCNSTLTRLFRSILKLESWRVAFYLLRIGFALAGGRCSYNSCSNRSLERFCTHVTSHSASMGNLPFSVNTCFPLVAPSLHKHNATQSCTALWALTCHASKPLLRKGWLLC